jgi:hypothetical protein
MKALAPDLFQRRFGDLVEIGRARLPALAPAWTDHNAHDPGITLMELLAWVAEAQLYSLSRSRRDERRAYAALLGVVPAGTQAARGLIWSDQSDLGSPAATFARTVVIPEDAVVNVLNADTPTFRPTHKLLWVPGKIQKLETRSPGRATIDHTAVNRRGGLAFLPFGERGGPRDVLAMTFQCRDEAGLFGLHRKDAKGASWSIGVRAAPPLGRPAPEPRGSGKSRRAPLEATLIDGDERRAVEIVSDSTEGFLTTGALLLDLGKVPTSPREFTIELRSPAGFPRPPRLLRIEPNVIPIEQGRSIPRELHISTGVPDWSFDLDVPGLRFSAGQEPITVEVAEASGLRTWRRCDRLSETGPDEHVYEIDPAAGRVTFGNGINGRIAPAESQVLVSYAVSDAEQGSVARNRKWKVAGFGGAFGINPDPITGGAGPFGWTELRREARRRSREDRALVSSADIVAAAKSLPLLEVARAWVVPLDEKTPQTGAVTLVAMRSRPSDTEPRAIPETARWLEAIRRRLVARMPLGARLVVTAPRYVGFTIRARLEAAPGRDPAVVKKATMETLRTRLALVTTAEGADARQAGVPLTGRDVKAWLRGVDGVGRIVDLRLVRANGRTVDEIVVPMGGLPRWDEEASDLAVSRPGTRSAP